MKMDLSTVFWLFFILVALQPVLKKRLLLATRQRLIAGPDLREVNRRKGPGINSL